jgi:ferrous iron transport protein B
MSNPRKLRIALAGKPNAGKSSLFNQLTGLNQKVGNFPGVTVDKKTGTCELDENTSAEILDLPGTYSLYPRSLDERIVAEVFADRNGVSFPDKVVLVADTTNLKNCFLLLTQLIDLGIPTVVALNMVDVAAKSGMSIDIKQLSQLMDVPVVFINARKGQGIEKLKKLLAQPLNPSTKKIFTIDSFLKPAIKKVKEKLHLTSDYQSYQLLQQKEHFHFLSNDQKEFISSLSKEFNVFPGKYQGAETIVRYGFIQEILNKIVMRSANPEWNKKTHQLDKVFTHKIWGYAIFFAILFLIFQSIFTLAQIPMDFIDGVFAQFSNFLKEHLPEGPLFEMVASGIVPGIGGIVIFIPQIAILFAFIAILEETGYMARVVFLMDKIMRRFGLNGKSVVPLMSGWACAIPAIMATRTIESWKDRLITIFVIPFMSCSARLPVFAILVALIVPDIQVLGFFNLQGLALMGLYLLGFLAAILSAWALKAILNAKERSFLIMEMPSYRMPKWSNIGYTIVEKTKAFVFEAGKVILAISIILWILASYGPAEEMAKAKQAVTEQNKQKKISENEYNNQVAAYKLEHSYAGIIGKAIEPAIKPLGYDWKIGIALITSFAAREVFVGTIATIYSLGSTEEQPTIRARLQSEINPETGGPRFTPAVGFSLLVFYTFAMQCASTLAVVKRETKGWRWPLIQLVYMSSLAYLFAFVVFQILS